MVAFFMSVAPLAAGLLASIMSTSILTVISPQIMEYFGTGFRDWQLRNVLFFGIFAGFMLLFGKRADRVSPKSLLSGSLLLFILSALGSLLAAKMVNWPLFLFFQSSQALADAALVPAVMKIIKLSFPEDKLGLVFGIFGSMLSGASVLGPLVGSLFGSLGPGWIWVFLFLAVVASWSLICVRSIDVCSGEPDDPDPPKSILGDTLASGALACAIISAQFVAKGPLAISLFALSLAAFLFSEFLRPDRVVPWSLLRFFHYSTSVVRALLTNIVGNVGFLIFPVVLQQLFGFTAPQVAFLLALEGVVIILAGGPAGKMVDFELIGSIFLGNTLILIGLICIAGFWGAVSLGAATAYYLLFAAGSGLSSAGRSKLVMKTLDAKISGQGMAFYQMLQFTSGAFSAGLIGSVFLGEDSKMTPDSWQMALMISASFMVINLMLLTGDFLWMRSHSDTKGVSSADKRIEFP